MGINQTIGKNLMASLLKRVRGRIGNEGTAKNVIKGDKFEEKGNFGVKEPKINLSKIHSPKGYSDYAKEFRKHITDKKMHQSAKLGKHPGFKKVQSKIEKEGYSSKVAGAILASRTRHASAAAHKSNPHLNRVKG